MLLGCSTSFSKLLWDIALPPCFRRSPENRASLALQGVAWAEDCMGHGCGWSEVISGCPSAAASCTSPGNEFILPLMESTNITNTRTDRTWWHTPLILGDRVRWSLCEQLRLHSVFQVQGYSNQGPGSRQKRGILKFHCSLAAKLSLRSSEVPSEHPCLWMHSGAPEVSSEHPRLQMCPIRTLKGEICLHLQCWFSNN